MSVIFILLPASLLVALAFLCAFIWSVKDHQFDDEFSPPVRILFEDGPVAGDEDPDRVHPNPTTI
ncbi:MAG TPA: cbb3-type cytochrome oxidase assembly protein CcoS [Puia sp.]|nr:cbb3-type cytochrome oxidase assembly protein CcoS [Puia sp.]